MAVARVETGISPAFCQRLLASTLTATIAPAIPFHPK
jgi:hypothetical protein